MSEKRDLNFTLNTASITVPEVDCDVAEGVVNTLKRMWSGEEVTGTFTFTAPSSEAHIQIASVVAVTVSKPGTQYTALFGSRPGGKP